MVTSSDSLNTVDIGKYYAILSGSSDYSTEDYITGHRGRRVDPDFCYNSGTNPHFLSVPELRELIAEHVESGSFLRTDHGSDSRHPHFTELKTVA